MTIVKICGITNLDDALCAVEAGADLLGFIFYPKSPRSVSFDAAAEIACVVRQSKINLIGVFVNESPTYMLNVLDEVGLNFAQLSGTESPHDMAAMTGRAYKAIREWNDDNAAFMRSPITDYPLPDLFLDANHATLFGGSGVRADESLAKTLAKRYRLLLAGGLTPENVADAIRAVKPWGVDVASGVEASPGKKDHAKVRAFITAAKAAL